MLSLKIQTVFFSTCTRSDATKLSLVQIDNQKVNEIHQVADDEERRLTKEERESFFAPKPAFSFAEFVPSHQVAQPVFRPTIDFSKINALLKENETPDFKTK